MYLVPIAWIYVVLMMSVAEATNTNGTVLGAIFTFLIYGAAPVALILYFMGTPARKRALRAQEAAERASAIAAHAAESAAAESVAPDTSGHTTRDAVAPVRKEP